MDTIAAESRMKRVVMLDKPHRNPMAACSFAEVTSRRIQVVLAHVSPQTDNEGLKSTQMLEEEDEEEEESRSQTQFIAVVECHGRTVSPSSPSHPIMKQGKRPRREILVRRKHSFVSRPRCLHNSPNLEVL